MFSVDFKNEAPIQINTYKKIKLGRGVEVVAQYVCNGNMLWLQFNNNTV